MKKYATTLILVGIIIVLAVVLAGTLIYLKNQPPQSRALPPVTTVKALEPNSSIWGLNYPNEYSSLLQTADNATSTTYGGSGRLSYLTLDPRLVILFSGFSFSQEYNQPRGHQDTLIDVREPGASPPPRTPPATPANPPITPACGRRWACPPTTPCCSAA